MTTIDRLGLLGIRSYGADNETFIRFYRPLTIILGRNGSGKSTIIEAVKMATTGDPPPMADKGAAFIHDPRIDNSTETKAKIRLLFTNAKGDEYIVCRNFQLTMKKARGSTRFKTEFKTLDQSLRLKAAGESKHATTAFRCGDLNALLPDIMRVSKPILNNVIFVHQEESLWPLGDPKKLKEKFDDIFAATRYTKALETIRKYRKEQAVDLKVLNHELARFEDKVQAVESLRLECESLRESENRLRRGMLQSQATLEELKREAASAKSLYDEFESKKRKLENHEQKIQHIEKSQEAGERRMTRHIKDLDDAGLLAEQQRLKDRLESVAGEKAERKRLVDSLVRKVDSKQTQLMERQARRGALVQNDRLNKKDLEQLESMKQAFHGAKFLTCGISEEDGSNTVSMDISESLPTPSSSTKEWTYALNSVRRANKRSVEAIKKAKEKALKEASVSVNEAMVNLRTAEESFSEKKRLRREQTSELQRIRIDIQNMGDSRSKFEEAKEREAAAKDVYERKVTSSSIKELERKSEAVSVSTEAADRELKDIRSVRDGLLKDERLRSDLEFSKKEVSKAERNLRTGFDVLLDKVELGFREVQSAEKLVPNFMPSDRHVDFASLKSADFDKSEDRDMYRKELTDACDIVLSRKDALLLYLSDRNADLKSAFRSATDQEASLKGRIESAETRIRSQEVSLGRARRELLDVPRVDESPAVEDLVELFQTALVVSDTSGYGMSAEQVQKSERTVKNIDKEVAAAQQRCSLSFAYARFAQDDLDKFESSDKKVCPTCGLSSSKKVESMRRRMEEKVARHKNPSEQAKEEDVIKKLQRTSTVLKRINNEGASLVSNVETYVPLKNELQASARKASNCKKSLDEIEKILRDVQEHFGLDSVFGDLEARRADVNRLAEELRTSARQLKTAMDNLPPGIRGQRSVAEVNVEITAIEERISQHSSEQKMLLKQIGREREDIEHANTRYHTAIAIRGRCQEEAKKCAESEAAKERLVEMNNTLDEDLKALQNQIPDLSNAKDDAALTFSTVEAEQSRLEENAMRNSTEAVKKIEKWEDLVHKTESYASSSKQNELETLVKSISEMEGDIGQHKQDIKTFEQEAEASTSSEHGIKSALDNIETNQEYRLNEHQIRSDRRAMRHIQDDINRLKGQAVGGDPAASVEAVAKKMEECRSSLYNTEGKHTHVMDMYKAKKREYDVAENEGSRRLYDQCRIEKQTMELASTDLDRYHRALDQALMAFHTLKMNSINRIIKELWQRTYRGTDIDEIEITSDAGEALGGSGARSVRSYNYRVMMRQGQAQLDMRGRCSAGQKVLACLVIRLALAESFCTDCGILALDEPTTNLDHENIESLAFALKSIIEHRRKQRNFQLVLITHDREFIEMIGARDFANEFFMVYKDSNGMSHAKVQDLTQLPE